MGVLVFVGDEKRGYIVQAEDKTVIGRIDSGRFCPSSYTTREGLPLGYLREIAKRMSELERKRRMS